MARDMAVERDAHGQPVRLWFGTGAASGVTPHVDPGAAILRCTCGATIPDKRRWRGAKFCSRRCKDEAYNRAHPVSRQARLDFTPAASELAHAVRGRETKAQRIVARLRAGKATTWELAAVGGIRFGARLQELEARGLRYEREDHADHSIYRMTQEPREGE